MPGYIVDRRGSQVSSGEFFFQYNVLELLERNLALQRQHVRWKVNGH